MRNTKREKVKVKATKRVNVAKMRTRPAQNHTVQVTRSDQQQHSTQIYHRFHPGRVRLSALTHNPSVPPIIHSFEELMTGYNHTTPWLGTEYSRGLFYSNRFRGWHERYEFVVKCGKEGF